MMPLKEIISKHFMGRKYELDFLKNSALRAASGEASSVVLSGQKGTGKTELLKHLYHDLFKEEGKTIPFFYTVKPSVLTIERFSHDYLYNFVLKSLAYIKRDDSLIIGGIYTLDDLRGMALKSELQWIADIIDEYEQVRESGDLTKLFTFAVFVPHLAYIKSGRPVCVILDEFHNAGKLCSGDDEMNDSHLWKFFEHIINFNYTPHILAGFHPELHRMFYEETSVGEDIEFIRLDGLNRKESLELFKSLSVKYRMSCVPAIESLIDIFKGNPFYITCFAQAARLTATHLTEDSFWDAYVKEVSRGKIHVYWTYILKTYLHQFKLRRPALHTVHCLMENSSKDLYTELSGRLSMTREEVDEIIHALQSAGAVEIGFSTLRSSRDRVLNDVFKALYYDEVLSASEAEASAAIRSGASIPVQHDEARLEIPSASNPEPVSAPDRVPEHVQKSEAVTGAGNTVPSFDISIPASTKAQFVAVKSLEHVGQHFNLPAEDIGQLQLSLAEVFNTILGNNGASEDSYELKYYANDSMFSLEILTSRPNITLSGEDSSRIAPYVDNVRVEQAGGGSKIILGKKFNGELLSQ